MKPYADFRIIDNLCFVSGQVPIENGVVDTGNDFYKLTKEALESIRKIALSQKADLTKVIKTTLFTTDISKLDEINKAYLEVFKKIKPVRSAIEVSNLAGNVNLEIDAVISLK